MLSRLFARQSTQPRFAQGLFAALLVVFTVIVQVKPVVGLAGLGTTAMLGAALIELNRRAIWDEYRRAYKKRRGLKGFWHEPKEIYYTVNVVILWPFVAVLGVLCLWSAYVLDKGLR